MGLTVIIIIVVVVIAIIALSKKEQGSSVSTSNTSFSRQEDYKAKMQELHQELVRIGHETLTSLEMNKTQKEILIGNVIDSIRENASAEEKDLMFQIMRKSYATLLDKFSFDKEFCTELSKHSMNMEDGIKNHTIETYGWDELIVMMEDEKEKIRNIDTTDILERSFSISFIIKGLQYRDKEAQEAARELEEGDTLELEKEPNNKYDSFAVKVLTTDGYCIGYVEAGKAEEISINIGRLIECKVQAISEHDELFIYGMAYFK